MVRSRATPPRLSRNEVVPADELVRSSSGKRRGVKHDISLPHHDRVKTSGIVLGNHSSDPPLTEPVLLRMWESLVNVREIFGILLQVPIQKLLLEVTHALEAQRPSVDFQPIVCGAGVIRRTARRNPFTLDEMRDGFVRELEDARDTTLEAIPFLGRARSGDDALFDLDHTVTFEKAVLGWSQCPRPSIAR